MRHLLVPVEMGADGIRHSLEGLKRFLPGIITRSWGFLPMPRLKRLSKRTGSLP